MPSITGMFQSSSTASGIAMRHCSSAVAAVLGLRRGEVKLLEDAPRHLADDGAVIDHQAMFHAFRSFASRLRATALSGSDAAT